MPSLRGLIPIILSSLTMCACATKLIVPVKPPVVMTDESSTEKWAPVKQINLILSPDMPKKFRDQIEITLFVSSVILDKDIFHSKNPKARQVFLDVEPIDPKNFGICECQSPVIKSCKIRLNASMIDNPSFIIEEVFLHEVGHAFGLDHVADPNDIMSEGSSVEDSTPLTLSQFEEFLHRLLNQDANH